MTDDPSGLTQFGFDWGPMTVERTAMINGTRFLRVLTDTRTLEIRVSPTGQSVRVFRNGRELK